MIGINSKLARNGSKVYRMAFPAIILVVWRTFRILARLVVA